MKISSASCCSKMFKWDVPAFTSTCFRNLKNQEGSVADLDVFKRDISFTNEGPKGYSVFEAALKLDLNCTMVLRHLGVALI